MENAVVKSKPNPGLVEEVLKDEDTQLWDSTSHDPYILVEVDKDSDEYKKVDCLFSGTTTSYHMIKLERVENPYLVGHYLMKREKMLKGGSVYERLFFHGTKKENVDGICKFNFDWRRNGNARGHKFGQGVSFTPDAYYASHYSPYDEKVMFLAKVLTSRETEGDCDTVVPPENYDTTVNGRRTVFVKYEDDDFYPQYVIHFKYK